ncbi:MAG: hypothetical protein IKZ87_04230 [Actinomycetaceae bacterium]|nr:hypothetical protein [Actinomycetaceae bacterium]
MRLDLGAKGYDSEIEQRALEGVCAAQEYTIKAMAHLLGNYAGLEGAVAVNVARDLLKKTWRKAVEVEMELTVIKMLVGDAVGMSLKKVQRCLEEYQDIADRQDNGEFAREVNALFTFTGEEVRRMGGSVVRDEELSEVPAYLI